MMRRMMRTPEETKLNYQHHLGDEAGATYYEIVGQVLLLHSKWGDYRALYAKENRVDLLNEAAPEFFGRLQDTLLTDVLLHIARHTDPEKSAGKANLSIAAMVARLRDKAHSASLEQALSDMDEKATAARDWRNRRIAHNDYKLALDHPSAQPLQTTSRDKIKEAIEAITAVVNAVSIHYMDSTMFFEFDDAPATDLIYMLHDGVQAHKRRNAKWAAGDPVDEDELRARNL
jgi:hypothetical protein